MTPADDSRPDPLGALVEQLAQRTADLVVERLRPATTEAEAPGWLSYSQAAELTSLPATAIRSAVSRGELLASRIGARTVRIARADLDAWLCARTPAVRQAAPPRLRRVGGAR